MAFFDPIILLPKSDYVKLVIDARILISVTEPTNYSWHLEPVHTIMTRVIGKFFSVSDLSCANHQVPLSPETRILTSFSIRCKQYTHTRVFIGLCGLPSFFRRTTTKHFEPPIKQKQAMTNIDETIMQSGNKDRMFSSFHENHELLRKAGLSAAPEKASCFPKEEEILGRIFSSEGIQPIGKRVTDLKNLKTPQCERDVMKVLGCVRLYSCYIKIFHVDSKPLCNLISHSTSFHFIDEMIFQIIKDKISEGTILAIPSTEYPFHFHVVSSNVENG